MHTPFLSEEKRLFALFLPCIGIKKEGMAPKMDGKLIGSNSIEC